MKRTGISSPIFQTNEVKDMINVASIMINVASSNEPWLWISCHHPCAAYWRQCKYVIQFVRSCLMILNRADIRNGVTKVMVGVKGQSSVPLGSDRRHWIIGNGSLHVSGSWSVVCVTRIYSWRISWGPDSVVHSTKQHKLLVAFTFTTHLSESCCMAPLCLQLFTP